MVRLQPAQKDSAEVQLPGPVSLTRYHARAVPLLEDALPLLMQPGIGEHRARSQLRPYLSGLAHAIKSSMAIWAAENADAADAAALEGSGRSVGARQPVVVDALTGSLLRLCTRVMQLFPTELVCQAWC